MTQNRKHLLLSAWALGLLTIIASSFEEPKPSTPPIPVMVDYTISSSGSALQRALDTRSAELTNMILSGSYLANQGDKMTLDKNNFDLDTGSRFMVTIESMTADDDFNTDASFNVLETLDVGVNHNPVAGQFSSLNAGTSTIISVTGSGVDVAVAAEPAESFDWASFIDLENDSSASIDLRVASAAYNMIEVILNSILLAEDVINDIESNKTILEGMNINTTLSISCDNNSDDGDGQARLIWTSDAAGSGQGLIGDDDAFEARFDSCRDDNRSHFRDGELILENYDSDIDSGPGTFSINADLRSIFLSDQPVDLDTVPTAASPQIDGQLFMLYIETVIN